MCMCQYIYIQHACIHTNAYAYIISQYMNSISIAIMLFYLYILNGK